MFPPHPGASQIYPLTKLRRNFRHHPRGGDGHRKRKACRCRRQEPHRVEYVLTPYCVLFGEFETTVCSPRDRDIITSPETVPHSHHTSGQALPELHIRTITLPFHCNSHLITRAPSMATILPTTVGRAPQISSCSLNELRSRWRIERRTMNF